MTWKEDWKLERRLCNRWAIWRLRDDSKTVMRACGLTWAGSPLAIMSPIYTQGAKRKEDVTGYAPEPPPPPDYFSPVVDQFMASLALIVPAAHAALMARHCRIVHGEHIQVRSEVWVAQALYCKSRTRSHVKLVEDCSRGYEALKRWLEKHSVAA